jgi:multidrug efflux pump
VIGPNLSEWALAKRSLIIFLMIVSVIAGTLSFLSLGRGEDPAFTVRTMIVAAAWPGATVEETMKQVTERLERTLQETDHLDTVRSYTTAGQTTIFVDLEQSTPPAAVTDVWYQVRKNVGDMRQTLPTGVVGPFFNDDFGSTFGIIYAFTADGFTFRELRDHVEAARSRLLQVPDVSKIEVLGAQDEQIFIEFSTERLAGLRLDYQTIVATLRAQNVVRPAGTLQTEQERVFLRVSGAFDSESEIEAVNIVAGDRIFRLGDIATVRRGFTDPPQPMFRVNGKPAIGIAIAMRDAGDILALGENVRAEMADIKANLPQGIEPTLVADQAATVDVAINDFMTSLWQAIVIILACSFVALGVRPGTVVALAIPLTMAIVFAVMDVANIDLHRISLGALIIALGMLVDDAMTTVDAMLRRLGAGDSPDQAATFAYRTLAAPMLIGTLVTIASFVPVGFAKSSAGEYTFSIFSVVAISLIVSWLVAVIFAPDRHGAGADPDQPVFSHRRPHDRARGGCRRQSRAGPTGGATRSAK